MMYTRCRAHEPHMMRTLFFVTSAIIAFFAFAAIPAYAMPNAKNYEDDTYGAQAKCGTMLPPGGGAYGVTKVPCVSNSLIKKIDAINRCKTAPTGLNGGSIPKCPDAKTASSSLSTRLTELQSRADDLFNKHGKRGGHASSTSNSGTDNWKDRYCSPDFLKTAKFSEAGYAQYLKTCERWKNASTTPPVVKPKATSTPVFKLVRPNGKVSYKHRVDGAVMISWRNATKDKTIDIDLKKGSTTTSIAKDVVGKKMQGGTVASTSGQVLGASSKSDGLIRGGFNSVSGSPKNGYTFYSNDNDHCVQSGSSFLSKSPSRGVSCSGKKSSNVPTLHYRWLNAPIGDGYQIVITAKDGDKTYTDTSKEFSVKKLPKGVNWYEEESEVLGASTSAEEEMDAVLNQIEDTLIEMTVKLAS